MASNKKYWRGFAELEDTQLVERLEKLNEFPEQLPIDEFLGDKENLDQSKASRRDFLKFVGFSTAAAALASCEGPVIKSIPYVIKPADVTPGMPTYYASTLMNAGDFASVLIKTREGRPIKVEGNPATPYYGHASARVQGSVLSLYNSQRLKQPFIDGKETELKTADAKVIQGLNTAKSAGKQIVILSPSYPSPSFKNLVVEFTKQYPTTQLVTFDADSHSAAIDAFYDFSGVRALPIYALDQAKLIVSFGADFLGDYNGGSMVSSYAKARIPGENMARHIQVESTMSLTGANADTRFSQKPTQVEKTLVEVYNGLTSSTNDKIAQAIVAELKASGSNAVVVADGSKESIYLSYVINNLLQAKAFDTTKINLVKESNDALYNQMIADAKAGKIGALINCNTNFVYASAQSKEIQESLKNIPLRVSTNVLADETSKLMNVLVPGTHWLESWGDANPVTGVYTLTQPTIRPLFEKIRQMEESLLVWKGKTPQSTPTTENSLAITTNGITNYYDFIKKYWVDTILPKAGGVSFNKALYDGVVEVTETASLSANSSLANAAVTAITASKIPTFELQLYTKPGIGAGQEFNNPWMQEFSDPITRTSWDNYATVSLADAKALGIENDHEMSGAMNGRYVKLTVGNVVLDKVPVLVQPGQAKGSIGLALGYGQENKKLAEAIGLEEGNIGVNAYPFYQNNSKKQAVSIEKVDGQHGFACIQLQNTLMGRDKIMREVTLEDFINKPSEEWNEIETLGTHNGTEQVSTVDLWTSFDRSTGHHFNMSIDLNACIGCGACVVSCQSENNVPVVGKHEVRVSRDMQWLRIDRYYTSEKSFEEDAEKAENLSGLIENVQGFNELEQPAENPQVAFQPVMCQHCNHAPCETVCPVAATSHGKQGQNQMAYNRCIGTRYCANNCPYKVRRFNWFNYANNDDFDFNMNDDMGRMVLNPDVAVRSRGVMEKCSMCIQMTQATILKAKKEGRGVQTDEFKTACSVVCPTNAIVFGDVNDEKSQAYAKLQDPRQYYLLEHIGTKPNVFYQVKVRNTGK